jgi:hypothetical protein
MAIVVADMSMSVDGFMADRNDEVGPLFDWHRDERIPRCACDFRKTFVIRSTIDSATFDVT